MPRKKLKVMVVEDEELLLKVIEKKLIDVGMDVNGFKSGEESIKSLEDDANLPDVIWLDYHLRGMDGLEFVLDIKMNKKLAGIPIVVVSNSANDSTVSKLLEAGANKYLLKAQNRLEDVIDIIKTFYE